MVRYINYNLYQILSYLSQINYLRFRRFCFLLRLKYLITSVIYLFYISIICAYIQIFIKNTLYGAKLLKNLCHSARRFYGPNGVWYVTYLKHERAKRWRINLKNFSRKQRYDWPNVDLAHSGFYKTHEFLDNNLNREECFFFFIDRFFYCCINGFQQWIRGWILTAKRRLLWIKDSFYLILVVWTSLLILLILVSQTDFIFFFLINDHQIYSLKYDHQILTKLCVITLVFMLMLFSRSISPRYHIENLIELFWKNKVLIFTALFVIVLGVYILS